MNTKTIESYRNFFDEFNSSPYEILKVSLTANKKDIKNAYKKRSLELHPDKNLHDTTHEFQILNMAYHVVVNDIRHIDEQSISDFGDITYDSTELDAIVKDDDGYVIKSSHQNGYETLPPTTETNYTNIQLEKPDKLMEKFDIDNFNAIFDYLKEKNETEKQIVKVEEIVGYNKINQSQSSVISDGEYLLSGELEDVNDYTNGNGMDFRKGFDNFKNLTKEELTIIKQNVDNQKHLNKNNMPKMKKGEMQSLINKKFKPINVVHQNKSFAEIKADFLNNQIENMRIEKDKSKKVLKKYQHVFNNKLEY